MTEHQSPDPDAKDHHPVMLLLLVIAETVLSVLMRIDQTLGRLAAPLVQQHTMIKVVMNRPHAEFYARFTSRGILLDFTPPEDGNIAAILQLPSLLRLDILWILFSEKKLRQSVQLSGAPHVTDILMLILSHFSVAHIVNKWLAVDQIRDKLHTMQTRLRSPSKQQKPASQDAQHKPYYSAALIGKVNAQQKQLEDTTIALKEKDYTIRQMRRKLRHISITAVLLLFMLLMCGGYLLWR